MNAKDYSDPDYSADVVIVGCGVAGALTAAGLAQQGVNVLMIDAGPRITRENILQAYAASPQRGLPTAPYPNVSHASHPIELDPNHYLVQAGPEAFGTIYERVVGGTTWHWEATCLRLLPSDFRLRSETGLGEDWPLSYDELETWYGAAETALGVAGNANDNLGSPRKGDYPMPAMPLSYLDQQFAKILSDTPYNLVTTPAARNSQAYGDRAACCGSGSCIPICPSGAKYDALVHVELAEAAGAQVVADCVVHHVDLDERNDVAGLRFKRSDGTDGTIVARVFVLAAHGLETAKILLMSKSERYPNGVANTSDQVGRNLMDHPYKVSWALSDQPLWPFRGPITLSSVENTRWGNWRALRPAYRIVVGNSGWAWPTGAPISTVNDLIDQGLEGAALDRAIKDHVSRQVLIASMTEQLPDPDNRIVPDYDKRDAIGIPRPRLHYRYDAYTHRGMAEAETVHESILSRLGTDKPRHSPEPWNGAHIIGTYRMGDNPKSSVVNTDLQSHDHANLFLLGSGVFPTAGAANPTLTIAALSLRAVKPIMDRLSL